MASASATREAAPAYPTVDIRVLSQLSGADQHIDLADVPLSLTVAELKERIRQAAFAQPSAERQRLIYRGHALSRDGEAIGTIFSLPTDRPHPTQILHLVVRDLPQTLQGTPSSALPRHDAGLGVPPDSTGIRDSASLPQATGPHAAQIRNIINTAHVPGATPPFPFGAGSGPPGQHGVTPLPNVPRNVDRASLHERLLHQHRERVAQHMAIFQAHQAHAATAAAPDPAAPNVSRQANGESEVAAPNTTMLTGGGQVNSHGPIEMISGTNNQPNHETHTQSFTVNSTPSTAPPPNLGNLTDPTTHASQQPSNRNASSTTSIWRNSVPLSLAGGFQGAAHARQTMARHHQDLIDLNRSLEEPLMTLNRTQQPQPGAAHQPRTQLMSLLRVRNRAQEVINQILIGIRAGTNNRLSANDIRELQQAQFKFEELVNETRQRLDLLQNGLPVRDATTTSPTSASQDSSNAQRRERSRRSSNQQIADRPTRRDTSSTSQKVTAYLLSSPVGPCAVIFTDQGVFTGTGLPNSSNRPRVIRSNNAARMTSSSDSIHTTRSLRNPLQRLVANSGSRQATASSLARQSTSSGRQSAQSRNSSMTSPLQQEQISDNERASLDAGESESHSRSTQRHQDLDGPQRGQQQNQVQAQEQEQERGNDMFGGFAPIFRHMWHLIRIIGGIWFISRGSATYRIVLILIAFSSYLAVQLGVLSEPWERLRSHFDTLLGVGNEEQQQQAPGETHPADQQGEDERNVQAQLRQAAARVTPEEAANRLLHEAHERDRSWLRQQTLAIERGIALFVASLYPGVGERTIARREQARREAQERETAAQRPLPIPEPASLTGPEYEQRSSSDTRDSENNNEQSKRNDNDTENNTASSSSLSVGADREGNHVRHRATGAV